MTAIDTGNPRAAFGERTAARRRTSEWLVLGVTSLVLLFALGVAFGLITG